MKTKTITCKNCNQLMVLEEKRRKKTRNFTIDQEVYEGIVEMAKRSNRTASNTIETEMGKIVKEFNEKERKLERKSA